MEEWSYYNYFIAVSFTLVFGAYIAIGYFWLKHIYKKAQKIKNEFYDTLAQGLRLGTIVDLDDIYNLYNGLSNRGVGNGDLRINSLLQGFLVRIQSVETYKINYTDDEIKQWKPIVTELIKKNIEISPFSDLPVSERTILNDMVSFLDIDDTNSVKRKMKELAAFIQSRKEQLEKLEKQNKVSIPIAIVGIILTIVFGILSLI